MEKGLWKVNLTPNQPLTDPTSGQPLRRATSKYPVLGPHKSFFLV